MITATSSNNIKREGLNMMNIGDMIYETIVFIFSDFWKYIGFIILIAIIRGDIQKLFAKINQFIKKVMLNYRNNNLGNNQNKRA